MIRVVLQPEPSDFDVNVRQKGNLWLMTRNAASSNADFPSYWRTCLPELYSRYSNCCAYLGLYLHAYEGMGTVDHFRPKSKYPELAYEWSNYRLCTQRINARKREYEDVFDPFVVENGWFQLDFSSGKVFASQDVSLQIQSQINQTIKRLNLNAPVYCEARLTYWNEYCNDSELLERKAPFVYFEAKRQALL